MWVIMCATLPPLYIRSESKLGITARATEADRFETEMEATKRLLELRLPRDWLVIEQI